MIMASPPSGADIIGSEQAPSAKSAIADDDFKPNDLMLPGYESKDRAASGPRCFAGEPPTSGPFGGAGRVDFAGGQSCRRAPGGRQTSHADLAGCRCAIAAIPASRRGTLAR